MRAWQVGADALRAALKALAAEGRTDVDEAALIAARQANSELVAQGRRMTRHERLRTERRDRGYLQVRVIGNEAEPGALAPVDEPEVAYSADVGVTEQW